jgi:hypothetical protein
MSSEQQPVLGLGVTAARGDAWLTLDGLAGVQATSEHPDFPITAPLSSPPQGEWRAATPGEQVIVLQFGEPRTLRRLRLVFTETERSRTQEFCVSWWSTRQQPRELVRQQFNFSPDGATTETEDYELPNEELIAIELRITPDISGGDAVASLAELRVA